MTTFTEADFDRLSWHDCQIWAVELRVGDPGTEDWTSDLALDIDSSSSGCAVLAKEGSSGWRRQPLYSMA
jgi:hypothetical protein